MKIIVFLIICMCSASSFAGGWTATSPVEHVEIIRGQGFQIVGNFGNPSTCSVGNTIFVATSHPQYEHLLSMALSAFMADKKLRIYSHRCINYGWHGGTHNELTGSGSMYIHK